MHRVYQMYVHVLALEICSLCMYMYMLSTSIFMTTLYAFFSDAFMVKNWLMNEHPMNTTTSDVNRIIVEHSYEVSEVPAS